MKQKFKHKLLAFLLIVGTFPLLAQVNIGQAAAPERGALLQIMEQDGGRDGGATVENGGLLLPRVNLASRSELLPFAVGATEIEKKRHKGLMVYNLADIPTENLKIGINVRNGKEWISFSQSLGQAEYEVICDRITIYGIYEEGAPLRNANFLTVYVTVIKEGTYEIEAKPGPIGGVGNGYYFHLTGEFKQPGTYELVVSSFGTPLTANAAEVVNVFFDGDPKCSITHEVKMGKSAHYTFECTGVAVKGNHFLDMVVSDKEYIEVKFTASPYAIDAVWKMSTTEINGISFSGVGVISSENMTVKLQASGTPKALGDNIYPITTNSTDASVAACSPNITVTYPRLTVLGIGNATSNVANSQSGGYQLLNNSRAFALTGAVRDVSGFILYDGGDLPGDYIKAVKDIDPDIIVFANASMANPAEYEVLSNYVKAGGVLLIFDEQERTSSIILGQILNTQISTVGMSAAKSGDVFAISNSDNPILNGPFGDARGKLWGMATSPLYAYIPQLASSSEATILAQGYVTYPTHATGMYAANKGVLWFADPFFIRAGNSTAFPFTLNANGLPTVNDSWPKGKSIIPLYLVTLWHGL